MQFAAPKDLFGGSAKRRVVGRGEESRIILDGMAAKASNPMLGSEHGDAQYPWSAAPNVPTNGQWDGDVTSPYPHGSGMHALSCS